MSNNLPNISPELLKNYQEEISSRTSPTTAKRKMSSLKRFFNWAEKEGHIDQNPISTPAAPIAEEVETINPAKPKSRLPIFIFRSLVLVGMVIIIFLLVRKLKLPIPFRLAPAAEQEITTNNTQIEPTTTQVATLSPWTLAAKMNLKDGEGNPAIGSQTITFKLYKTEEDTQSSWTSNVKQLTPDAEGDIFILLEDVPIDLFFKNERLFLAAETSEGQLGARLPVATVNVAANLQGYYPAEAEEGAEPNTIPVISKDGSLLLATESPSVKAAEGNLLVEGQTLTLSTPPTSDGDITINPDGAGIAHFLFEGTSSNFLNAQAPNLISGSLYYGIVANNATGYDLLKLQSGSNPITRFSIDALGNTDIGGNLNVEGDISTDNVVRLTSSGALSNITGYEQESGNFSITQNGGETATIIKKASALSDLLTLTLDERGYSNSDYSALTLKRYDGSNDAMALLVEEGNAQFNGQLRLGRFATNPSTIGEGSLVYNTGDDKLYYYTAAGWAEVGGGSYWQQISGVLSPVTGTDDLAIGGTDSSAPFFVDDSGNMNVDNNTFVVDATNNRVAIGNANPNMVFEVNSGANQYLMTDPNSGEYAFGDINYAANGSYLYIDDNGEAIYLMVNDEQYLMVSPTLFGIGDSGAGNGTNLIINDTLETLSVSGDLDPSSDDNYDLGDTTTSWQDLYLTGYLCFDDTDCADSWGSAGHWTLSGTELYPNSTLYDVSIGVAGTGEGQKLTVEGNIKLGTTDSTRYIYFDDGTAYDPGIRYNASTNAMQFSHDGTAWDDMGSGSSYWQQISGVLSPVTGTDDLAIGGTDSSAPFFVDDSGNLTIDTSDFVVDVTTGNIGIGQASPTTDLHIGTNAETHTLDTSDVLISSDLEVDGVLYVDGGTISNVGGTATITFSGTPTTTYNSLSASSWLVENTANVGLAALMVNQTKDGDIFTASAGGSPKVTIDNSGNVGIGTTDPDAKLHVSSSGEAIYFGSGSQTYPSTPAGSNLVGKSATSDFRLSVQDGSGRASLYWNAYYDGSSSTHKYQVSSEQALRMLMSTNGFTFYTAAAGTAGDDISWNTAMNIDETAGYVGIGTTSPDGGLDVEGSGIYVSEISAPGTPNSGKGVLYEKTDGKIYFKNDAGTEYDLTRESIVYKETIVSNSSDQWVGSGSTVTITWDVEIIDEDSAFASSEYTAPATGNYDISWFINETSERNHAAYLQLDDGGGYATIYTDYEGQFSGATSDVNMTQDGTIDRYPLSAGDKLRWRFYAWGGGGLLAGNRWSIRRREVEGSDLAEWYQTPDQSLRAGDIITASVDNGAPVEPERLAECQKSSACVLKSNKPYDDSIVGIISSAPGKTLGKADGSTAGYNDSLQLDTNKTSSVLVALTGRVPIKIWEGSKAIKQGDYITTSPEAGLGMRANRSGKVVGVALEDWNPGENKDKILVFINPMYYESPFMLAVSEETGNILFEEQELILAKNEVEEATSSGQTNTPSVGYLLRDGADAVLEKLGVFTNLLVANIKAGMVTTKELTTDSLLAFQATVDNLLITNGLVSPVIETETISPLADSNLVFDLNNSPEASSSSYGKLIVKGEEEEEVVSINASGDATFSGTLETKELVAEKIYADEIISDSNITLEEIEELLKQSLEDQALLDDLGDSNVFTATDSASLNELVVDNLFVTEQAAMNNLSLSSSLAIGADFLIQSSTINDGISNTIDTLSAPLRLQSLAMAPIEIMAGKIRIDTTGNVEIAGNLNVAGEIKASSLTLKDSGFGNLLNLVNSEGKQVATINASGGAQFNNLITDKLVIASSNLDVAEPNIEGEIETNATVGSAVIPEGVEEVKIVNENVNSYTLVYVTPTSTTLNNVLYVKGKGEGYFTVGFNNPLSVDVNFNWWVVDVIE